jgi:hypothetical protein
LGGFFRAQFHTRTTDNALRREISDLWQKALTFGVTAPKTAKRTAFHKDQKPDAGAIVDGISIDVKDQAASIVYLKVDGLLWNVFRNKHILFWQ